MRDPTADVDDAVDEADRHARGQDRHDHDRRRVPVAEQQCADDRREGDRRADGEIDAARHDHEQLPERQDRDHRDLRQHVAHVVARAEHRCRRGDSHHQDEQDQKRPCAEAEERDLQQPVPGIDCHRT
jgi:hypothetical protein